MPENEHKNNDEKEVSSKSNEVDKTQEEELLKYLKEIKSGKKELSDEDIDKLQDMINQVMQNHKVSRFYSFLYIIKRITLKFVLLSVLGLVIMGFFFAALNQENKWFLFAYVLGICLLIAIFDNLYYNFLLAKFKYPTILYFIIIIGIASLTILTNVYFIPLFNDPYLWVIYYLVLLICHTFLNTYYVKRKYNL